MRAALGAAPGVSLCGSRMEDCLEILAPDDSHPAVFFGNICGKRYRRLDVLGLERGVMLENLSRRQPERKRVQNSRNGNTRAADDRLTLANVRIDGHS